MTIIFSCGSCSGGLVLLIVLFKLLLDCSGRAEELLNLLVESGQMVLLLIVFGDQALFLLK